MEKIMGHPGGEAGANAATPRSGSALPSLWNLCNPSDAVTFRADDHEAAIVAVIFLGEGSYPADEINGGRRVPAFLFNSPDPWFQERFGETAEVFFARVVEAKPHTIADTLDSFIYGQPDDRLLIEEIVADMGPGERADRLASWNDKRRTSMTNIVGRAQAIAARIRDKAKTPPVSDGVGHGTTSGSDAGSSVPGGQLSKATSHD